MFSRLKHFVLAIVAAAAISALVLPVAPASAEPAPWWQVLTGSRPSNLWEPGDNVQEVKSAINPSLGVLAARIKLEGTVIGCLGAGSYFGIYSADQVCQLLGIAPQATETAEELEQLLEAAYGTSTVGVTGGPAAASPFVITVPRRGVQPITVTPAEPFPNTQFGTASVDVLSRGGSGRLVLTLTNLGDGPVHAGTTPVTITDELPAGMEATAVEWFGALPADALQCEVVDPRDVACNFEGELPSYGSIEVEVDASLTGEPPTHVESGTVTVAGGDAPTATVAQEIKVSPEPIQFGIERFSAEAEDEGGGPVERAGSHPFQLTTTVQLKSGAVNFGERGRETVDQPAIPRNLRFPLPAGLVGNARDIPQCLMATFLAENELVNQCGDATAVGVAVVTFAEKNTFGLVRVSEPVFNLPPAHGEPARFAFLAVGVPVFIDTEVDPERDYRIIAKVSNASEAGQFLGSTVTLWGSPGDPRHDAARGWNCVYFGANGTCERPPSLENRASLRMPVTCSMPLGFEAQIEPWNVPIGSVVDEKPFATSPLLGCNQVPFDPAVTVSPTGHSAGGSSGFNFRLDMPNANLLNPNGIAEGQAKKVEVTLPPGMTVNPSSAEGLEGCSPAQYAQETASSLPGEGCPQASKIGEVRISTPLLNEEAHGSLYVATPHDNPFDSLVAVYMVAKIPQRGILVKQAGKVEADPVTGQLVTTFDNLPQIPFTTFDLHFKEGPRAPLVMPSACGSYEVLTKFTPWNAADPDNPASQEVVTKTGTFTVDQGPNGGACPSGTPPFDPKLSAGTLNNAAGKYSQLNLRLTREDGEQEFGAVSIKLPRGLIGKLAGIPFCSDEAIAAARARTGPHGGQEELDSPSCPASSQIGRLLVGAGVGSSLSYVPGKVYLAGPYNGAKLSVVAITPGRVGPYDLGTVVIRDALKVDPETAEVSVDEARSDPIPHILQGIPVRARDIRVYLDRPEFVLNPTSCEEKTISSKVVGSGLDFVSTSDDSSVEVAERFQAADCASLGFKPKLSLHLSSGKRLAFPKLRAVLKARKGDANIGAAQVSLPHATFLEQGHIRTVCTRVRFAAGGGNGEQCPKGSIYGRARAISPLLDEPLVGPVFLRSSSHELPDMVAALHSQKIDIDLVGRIDSGSSGGIRSTFESVPDAPVTKFLLEMQGGKKGLIVNSDNLCLKRHRAQAHFVGQNGRVRDFKPLVKARCGGTHKH